MVVRSTRWVLGLAALMLGLVLAWSLGAPSASAKPPSTAVRLGLTGMITSSAPHGTWSMTAHPGQRLGFLAGFVPGMDQLNVDKLASVQVSMDAETLTHTSHHTTLDSHSPYTVAAPSPGTYPVHWTVALVVGHGRHAIVQDLHQLDATIVVAGSRIGQGAGSGTSPQGHTATPAAVGSAPPPAPTAHKISAAPPARSASPTPTITLPADTGHSATHPQRPALAALPLAAPTDTFLYTAIVGTFVLGLLWLLWVASIKPILGR